MICVGMGWIIGGLGLEDWDWRLNFGLGIKFWIGTGRDLSVRGWDG